MYLQQPREKHHLNIIYSAQGTYGNFKSVPFSKLVTELYILMQSQFLFYILNTFEIYVRQEAKHQGAFKSAGTPCLSFILDKVSNMILWKIDSCKIP